MKILSHSEINHINKKKKRNSLKINFIIYSYQLMEEGHQNKIYVILVLFYDVTLNLRKKIM